MTIPALGADGSLPPGRYRTDLAELRQRFVAGVPSTPANHRSDLMAQFEHAIALTQQAAGAVAAVWVAGGFVSDKPDPGDIDTTFVIDSAHILSAQQDQTARDWLALVASNQLRSLGFQLDTFLIEWCVLPVVPSDWHQRQESLRYFATRGHWDDWWQRRRSGAAGAAPARTDALPRRGYLEVIVDDFT